AAARAVPDGIGHQSNRLDRRMRGELDCSLTLERIHACIIPDIRSRSPILAEFKVIDVWLCAVFPDQDQLMLGSVERSHAGIALVPDTNVFELMIDRAACHQHFEDMPPIDADIVN